MRYRCYTLVEINNFASFNRHCNIKYYLFELTFFNFVFFLFFLPHLYNSLPNYLRDIESVTIEKFKFELDKFLAPIPDEPKMPNYVTEARSNSILDQLSHLRASILCKLS